MIPPIYKHATVRCVIPSDGTRIGFACDVADGTIVRLAIPLDDARWMAESLIDYRRKAQCQSLISSGKENCDGSPQEGQ